MGFSFSFSLLADRLLGGSCKRTTANFLKNPCLLRSAAFNTCKYQILARDCPFFSLAWLWKASTDWDRSSSRDGQESRTDCCRCCCFCSQLATLRKHEQSVPFWDLDLERERWTCLCIRFTFYGQRAPHLEEIKNLFKKVHLVMFDAPRWWETH